MTITSDSLEWDDLVRMVKQVKDGPPVEMTTRAVLQIADHIESQAADLSAKQRIIDAQAGMIADLQERLRAETTELRMQMLSDEGQHIEETGRLRAALADLIDSAHRAAWVAPMQMPHRHDDLVHTIAKYRLIIGTPDNTPGDGDKTMGDA